MKLFTPQEWWVIGIIFGVWLLVLNIMDLVSNLTLRAEVRARLKKEGGEEIE